MIAEQVFKIISTKGSIEFAAAEEILATAGGSYIRINKSGIEHGTPADWKVWAATHGKPGPKNLEYLLPNINHKEVKYIGRVSLFDQEKNPLSGLKYRVHDSKGKLVNSGAVNSSGDGQYHTYDDHEHMYAYVGGEGKGWVVTQFLADFTDEDLGQIS